MDEAMAGFHSSERSAEKARAKATETARDACAAAAMASPRPTKAAAREADWPSANKPTLLKLKPETLRTIAWPDFPEKSSSEEASANNPPKSASNFCKSGLVKLLLSSLTTSFSVTPTASKSPFHSKTSVSFAAKVIFGTFYETGIVNGIFDDNRYRSNPKATVLQSVDVLGLGSGAAMIKRLKYAQYVSSGIVFVRELVNSPANILTPEISSAPFSRPS
ncbi:leucine aminopeptidase 2 [Cucumis melo var. makuwa]|uniref:Leucine aminopeptidase 2 n=2 Tax=Cucumis melo TaxID=3656 RepID=A0A5A7TEH5_CUCMM|nr:leucine aminopeptidase 2 [Cucumis melo var. makuwa]